MEILMVMEIETESDPIPVPPWSSLSWDLTFLILARLPLRSLILSSAVCRHWRSVTTHPTFPNPNPWLFLFSRNDGSKERVQAFGFDPDFHDWTRLPNSSHYFAAAAGFSFSSPSRDSPALRFAPLPGGPSTQAPEIPSCPRRDPLLGVFFEGSSSDTESMRFIVAGGVHPARNESESDDRPPTAIYAPALGTCHVYTPLPLGFQFPEARSKWLSSCVLHSRRLFVVVSRISGRISAFDLARKRWGRVRSVSPPQSVASYVVACGDTLVLACLSRSHGEDGACRFGLWRVDFDTLEVVQIGEMPRELLAYVYDSRNHSVFKNVRCVGVDGRVYVYGESHSRGYPACLCEIGTDGGGTCTWRRLPRLPWPVDCGEMIGFASTVHLQTILSAAR